LKASTSLFKKREADHEIQHIYWRVGRQIWTRLFEIPLHSYLPFQSITGVAPAGGNGDAHNYARLPRQPHTAGGFKEDDVEGDFLQQELHHIVSHTSLASPIRRNGYTAVRHSPYKPGKPNFLKKGNILSRIEKWNSGKKNISYKHVWCWLTHF
jgi:hypothetical protein